MDNTDFNYIDIADELGAATDNWLGKRAEEEMILIEDEDIDFECNHDCDGCWFEPESCGKITEQFVEFVKDQYGYEVTLEPSDMPDTFESIFGASFLNNKE